MRPTLLLLSMITIILFYFPIDTQASERKGLLSQVTKTVTDLTTEVTDIVVTTTNTVGEVVENVSQPIPKSKQDNYNTDGNNKSTTTNPVKEEPIVHPPSEVTSEDENSAEPDVEVVVPKTVNQEEKVIDSNRKESKSLISNTVNGAIDAVNHNLQSTVTTVNKAVDGTVNVVENTTKETINTIESATDEILHNTVNTTQNVTGIITRETKKPLKMLTNDVTSLSKPLLSLTGNTISTVGTTVDGTLEVVSVSVHDILETEVELISGLTKIVPDTLENVITIIDLTKPPDRIREENNSLPKEKEFGHKEEREGFIPINDKSNSNKTSLGIKDLGTYEDGEIKDKKLKPEDNEGNTLSRFNQHVEAITVESLQNFDLETSNNDQTFLQGSNGKNGASIQVQSSQGPTSGTGFSWAGYTEINFYTVWKQSILESYYFLKGDQWINTPLGQPPNTPSSILTSEK